jgi:hypothetical protein
MVPDVSTALVDRRSFNQSMELLVFYNYSLSDLAFVLLFSWLSFSPCLGCPRLLLRPCIMPSELIPDHSLTYKSAEVGFPIQECMGHRTRSTRSIQFASLSNLEMASTFYFGHFDVFLPANQCSRGMAPFRPRSNVLPG